VYREELEAITDEDFSGIDGDDICNVVQISSLAFIKNRIIPLSKDNKWILSLIIFFFNDLL